jgi:hypothetical protein
MLRKKLQDDFGLEYKENLNSCMDKNLSAAEKAASIAEFFKSEYDLQIHRLELLENINYIDGLLGDNVGIKNSCEKIKKTKDFSQKDKEWCETLSQCNNTAQKNKMKDLEKSSTDFLKLVLPMKAAIKDLKDKMQSCEGDLQDAKTELLTFSRDEQLLLKAQSDLPTYSKLERLQRVTEIRNRVAEAKDPSYFIWLGNNLDTDEARDLFENELQQKNGDLSKGSGSRAQEVLSSQIRSLNLTRIKAGGNYTSLSDLDKDIAGSKKDLTQNNKLNLNLDSIVELAPSTSEFTARLNDSLRKDPATQKCLELVETNKRNIHNLESGIFNLNQVFSSKIPGAASLSQLFEGSKELPPNEIISQKLKEHLKSYNQELNKAMGLQISNRQCLVAGDNSSEKCKNSARYMSNISTDISLYDPTKVNEVKPTSEQIYTQAFLDVGSCTKQLSEQAKQNKEKIDGAAFDIGLTIATVGIGSGIGGSMTLLRMANAGSKAARYTMRAGQLSILGVDVYYGGTSVQAAIKACGEKLPQHELIKDPKITALNLTASCQLSESQNIVVKKVEESTGCLSEAISSALLGVLPIIPGNIGLVRSALQEYRAAKSVTKVSAQSDLTLEVAAKLDDTQRVVTSAGAIKRDLTKAQELAIIDAHNVGAGELGKDLTKSAGHNNYTAAQISEKARILKESGFSDQERRVLMETGLVGNEAVPLTAEAKGLSLLSFRERDQKMLEIVSERGISRANVETIHLEGNEIIVGMKGAGGKPVRIDLGHPATESFVPTQNLGESVVAKKVPETSTPTSAVDTPTVVIPKANQITASQGPLRSARPVDLPATADVHTLRSKTMNAISNDYDGAAVLAHGTDQNGILGILDSGYMNRAGRIAVSTGDDKVDEGIIYFTSRKYDASSYASVSAEKSKNATLAGGVIILKKEYATVNGALPYEKGTINKTHTLGDGSLLRAKDDMYIGINPASKDGLTVNAIEKIYVTPNTYNAVYDKFILGEFKKRGGDALPAPAQQALLKELEAAPIDAFAGRSINQFLRVIE